MSWGTAAFLVISVLGFPVCRGDRCVGDVEDEVFNYLCIDALG